MTESAFLVATLVLAAGVVGGLPVASLAGGSVDGQVDANETNQSMAPGERLAGVVGVERASVEGEMASRTFGQRIATAASNDSRAAVVGDEIDDLQARLADLREQQDELEAAYENGSISKGEYQARMARLHAEQRALQRRANDTERVAEELPAETLRANGVNVTALRTIRTEAANLTGPEVAAIARNISGQHPGGSLGPDTAGPPGFAENRSAGGPPAEQGAVDGPPGTDQGPTGAGDNETGPPADAGNETDPPADAGNETDPPADSGNETSPPDDSGDETGPPGDSGNETNQPVDEGNETGPPGDTGNDYP